MTHSYVLHNSFICVAWSIYLYGVATMSRRLKFTGLFYRALLQKRPVIWKSLLTEATPYVPSRYWVTCLIHVCDIPYSYLWRDCVMTCSYAWHDSFICVTRLVHTCDMTDLYVWHDWFVCVTCLIHMCDMTHSYVWHDSFICVTWLTHMCDMTH